MSGLNHGIQGTFHTVWENVLGIALKGQTPSAEVTVGLLLIAFIVFALSINMLRGRKAPVQRTVKRPVKVSVSGLWREQSELAYEDTLDAGTLALRFGLPSAFVGSWLASYRRNPAEMSALDYMRDHYAQMAGFLAPVVGIELAGEAARAAHDLAIEATASGDFVEADRQLMNAVDAHTADLMTEPTPGLTAELWARGFYLATFVNSSVWGWERLYEAYPQLKVVAHPARWPVLQALMAQVRVGASAEAISLRWPRLWALCEQDVIPWLEQAYVPEEALPLWLVAQDVILCQNQFEDDQAVVLLTKALAALERSLDGERDRPRTTVWEQIYDTLALGACKLFERTNDPFCLRQALEARERWFEAVSSRRPDLNPQDLRRPIEALEARLKAIGPEKPITG